MTDAPALSIVVPAYNEQEVLPEFHRRLAGALEGIGLTWEVVYVNDGSRDTTPAGSGPSQGMGRAPQRSASASLHGNLSETKTAAAPDSRASCRISRPMAPAPMMATASPTRFLARSTA